MKAAQAKIPSELQQESWTTFEDVKHVTTDTYFNNNVFSIDAFNKKYAHTKADGSLETYPEAIWRVCKYVASVEKTEGDKEYWARRWFSEIYNDWWHPAGSIMQGAAHGGNVSMANCTTLSLGSGDAVNDWDNLESIYRNTMYSVAKCAAFRQGLGVDFSSLRPRKTTINNSARESTGSVHWMKAIDNIGYAVGQKGRTPAMLMSLSITHPDVEEFIKVKEDYTIIQNANISVQITDSFYEAVYNDDDWEMRFDIPAIKKGQKVYVDVHSTTMDCKQDDAGKWYYIATRDRKAECVKKTTKARHLLELIARGMCTYAEPGIQNIDIARKWSNSDYVYDPNHPCNSLIISTNACSEQYLSRDSNCILSSINAEKFPVDENKYDKCLDIVGHSINRFLDNVNECELVHKTYATPHQRMAIESLRRTGAGVTNIAGWLFKNNLQYGTTEGNEAVEKFNSRYNYYLYKSSIELGKLKGSFGLFNREKFEQSPFVQHMIDQGLVFDAMRNVTCSSWAPTGSLSTQFRDTILSYGVEPAFGLYYWKRTRISGKYEYYFVVPHIVRKCFADKGKPIPIESDTIKDTWGGKYGKPIADFIEKHKDELGIKFRSSLDVSPLEKLDMMARLMKDCDSSISVTYMLPEGSDWKDVYNFILEAHKRGVKSVAAFPDRKMYGIVSFISFKDLALKLSAEGVEIHKQNFTDDELDELGVHRQNITTSVNKPPKRPKDLAADVYVVKVSGDDHILVVGKLNESVFEMFGGRVPDGVKFPAKSQQATKGVVRKVKRGHYSLIIGNDTFENFSADFKPVEQMMFRMISMSMRHGIPIQFLVEQLEKGAIADEQGLGSLNAAARRVLKKYIKDGEKVSGASCPSCKSADLLYYDGCVNCAHCNWSKCS